MATGQTQLLRRPRPQSQLGPLHSKSAGSLSASSRHISFQQSLEVCQSMIEAGVCSTLGVIHADEANRVKCSSAIDRGLFADDAFEEEIYGQDGDSCEQIPGKTRKRTKPVTRVKKLKRNVLGEVDDMLDYLNGIFDALEKQYLKSFQLIFFEDPNYPHDAFECYTFSFAYHRTENATNVRMSMSSKKDDPSSIVSLDLKEVRANMQIIVRRLIFLTQDLTALPDNRWLTFRVFYYDVAPKDYQPPKFKDYRGPEFKMVAKGMEHVHSDDCGVFIAGYHAVSIKLLSYQISGTRQNTPNQELHEDEELENLPVKKSRRSACLEDDVQPPPIESFATHLVSRREVEEREALKLMLVAQSQDSAAVETQSVLTEASNMAASSLPSDQIQNPAFPEIPSRQTRGYGASNPSVPNVGMAPLSKNPTKLVAPDIAMETTADRSIDQQLSISEALASMSKLILSRDKMEELQKLADAQKARRRMSSVIHNHVRGQKCERCANKGKSTKIEAPEIIHCECGTTSEEGGMVQCESCSKWQHLACHGFLPQTKDPRLPDRHFCYKCLLNNGEQTLLEKMRELAFYRRAIVKVYEHGFPSSNNAFATLLGCDLQNSKSLTDRMANDGFLEMPIRRGRFKRDTSRINVVRNRVTFEKMAQEYFDPLRNIAHHFVLNSVAPTQSETCQTLQTPGNTSSLRSGSGAGGRKQIIPDSQGISESALPLKHAPLASGQGLSRVRPSPTTQLCKQGQQNSEQQHFNYDSHHGNRDTAMQADGDTESEPDDNKFSSPCSPSPQKMQGLIAVEEASGHLRHSKTSIAVEPVEVTADFVN